MSSRKEFLVGCLVVLAVALMLVFGWLMGVLGPFTPESRFQLLYGFAGGVEVGSPVRVSGVKVGKVERIEFLPDGELDNHDHSTLRVTISVAKRALGAVRQDSRFYVNMAGIIGERYIEISPGTRGGAPLAENSVVRGVDPPRIDQLLSQGYSVFGRIQEFMEQNESNVTDFLGQLHKLMNDANAFLKGRDRAKIFELIENLNAVSGDLRALTIRFKDPRMNRLLDQLSDLVERAHDVDKPALRKFLQEEGVRARIF